LTRAVFCMALLLSACASNGEQQPFMPRSDYPVDAWVKGYAQEDDCLGGEKLAAIKFDLPEYPRRAYKNGRQGWTLVQLDVDAGGQTQNDPGRADCLCYHRYYVCRTAFIGA